MTTLEKVRAIFAGASEIECVENTYRPELNGTRRQIERVRKTVIEGRYGGKPFRMELPKRAGDVLALSDEEVTYKLGDSGRLAGHTVTLRRA